MLFQLTNKKHQSFTAPDTPFISHHVITLLIRCGLLVDQSMDCHQCDVLCRAPHDAAYSDTRPLRPLPSVLVSAALPALPVISVFSSYSCLSNMRHAVPDPILSGNWSSAFLVFSVHCTKCTLCIISKLSLNEPNETTKCKQIY